jgi:translation initiation factor 6 (eIF-6)
MSKLKANKYQVAKEQLSKNKGVVVPEEINENEKDLFHVLIVDVKADRSTLEFVSTGKVQMFNKESFEKAKENFVRLGYELVVIFHDPNLPMVEVAGDDKLSQKEIEKIIDTLSIEDIEKMLEGETRVGVTKILTEKLELLKAEA